MTSDWREGEVSCGCPSWGSRSRPPPSALDYTHQPRPTAEMARAGARLGLASILAAAAAAQHTCDSTSPLPSPGAASRRRRGSRPARCPSPPRGPARSARSPAAGRRSAPPAPAPLSPISRPRSALAPPSPPPPPASTPTRAPDRPRPADVHARVGRSVTHAARFDVVCARSSPVAPAGRSPSAARRR